MSALFVAVDDYCVQKVLVAAAAASFALELKNLPSQEELIKLDPSAKSLLLQTSAGFLTQQNAILRYIAESNKAAKLMGSDEMEIAQIDQWLEFSWQELEVPVQALLQFASKPFLATPEMKEKAVTDIKNNLSVLEDHMFNRTYIVGERLSVADLSLYVVFSTLLQRSTVQAKNYPVLYRWYMTIGSVPTVASAMKSYVSTSSKLTDNISLDVSTVGLWQSSTGSWDRHRVRVKELLKAGASAIGMDITVKGWIRTSRSAEKGQILFVELTDGSTPKGLQIVIDTAKVEGAKSVSECGGVGASLSISGTVMASPAKGQLFEIHAVVATVIGAVYGGENGQIGAKNYPLAKKQHTLEFLREIAHLRPRSKVFSSAMRMRNAMAYATHKFFNERGFIYTHTPLITAADCEGAGEQFAVSTFLKEHVALKDIPVDKSGKVDFSKDFFGRRCCLTVSGQLNVETHACALCDVYTFGPTFRAEESHTSRHLAEFWMIEPEICFADLADDMALAVSLYTLHVS